MALTRKSKIWLILISVPVVLFFGLIVALKLYFTSDRLKAIIVPKLEEATGRPVTINKIRLSLFPSQAIEIDSLSIANAPGPGFSPTPMFALDRLMIDVRLLALLRDAVEIDRLELRRPRVFLEVRGDGTTNYGNRPQTASVPDTGKTGGTDIGRIVLSDFQIEDGTVDYVDRKKNSAMKVEGLQVDLNMEVKPVVHEAWIQSKTTIQRFSYGTATQPLVSNLRLASNQELLYERDKDLLTVKKADARVEDITLGIQGTVAGLSRTPALDITIESDKIKIADLLSLIPQDYMKNAQGLKGDGLAHVRITVKGVAGDSVRPDVVGSIAVINANVQYAGLPKAITGVNIVGDFARTTNKQELHITDFSAHLGDNPVSATMSVANFDNPKVTLAAQASMNLNDVKDFYPLDKGTELAGMMKASVNIEGNVNAAGAAGKAEREVFPRAMKVAGSLEFQNVTVKTPTSKKPVENLRGTIVLNNETIESKELSMLIGKSDLTLAFWLKNYLSLVPGRATGPTPTANLALKASHVYTSDVTSGGGALALPDVDMDISTTIGTLTMEKFALTNVRGSMKIVKGIIGLQNFSFNIFDGSFVTKGTLNLQKPERGTFDLAMDMNGVNAHSMLSSFTSFGERMYGKLGMKTTMKGGLDDTLGLIPQTLNGQGNVQVQSGKLTGVKVNKEVAGLLKLPDLEEINFKDWSNSFTIANGRIVIKDLKITTPSADYVVNGSQGLDGTLDYTMTLLLPEKTSSRVTVPGFAGQAINLFKDGSGRVKLDFAVGGTWDKPQVALDTKAAEKKAEELGKQKVVEEAKKLEEAAKKKAGDALKKLFKKK